MARGKAHLAVLAGALWVLGFDVVPLAHMLFHETLEEHHHGPADGRGPAEDEPSPTNHGEGSVAHCDLAANAPAPGVPEVLEALLVWSPPALPSHDERPDERRPQTMRARGPPAVTA